MRKPIGLLVVIFIIFFKTGSAQERQWKITGVVKNQSGSALSPASVFISNSTKGATTDTSGAFSISGLANGNYNVIVSFVGYETQIYPISINGKNDSVLFVMKENAKELQDVVINLKNGDRTQQLKIFRKAFIGTDKNARHTEILNEDILKLHTDPEGKITGHTNELLQISNKALGYNIKYLLKEFSYDKKTGDLHYLGYPLFEEMQSSSSSQKKEWQEAREKQYQTSLLRFYRTLGKRKLLQQGYIVGELTAPEEEKNSTGGGVAKKINVPQNGFLITLANHQYIDTLLYPEIPYYRLITALPGHKYRLNFSGMLSVDATNSSDGVQSTDYYRPGIKTSIITLKQPVIINENGLPANSSDVIIYGYWIDARIADLLPFDYYPPNEKKL
jgi:hypothetical protein